MPGSETTQFPSYDNDGNLLQRIDGNSVVTNYLYTDSESLLTDIQYPATTSLNVHFTYDGYGRRSGMTDGTGSQSYTYGNLDELLSTTTTYTGLAAKTISYAYHPDGSRQTMTTPAGTFSYNYDAAGRPASMTNPFSETTSWVYQNNNWLQSQTLANGATATYTQNGLGQVTRLLTQIGTNTISDFSSIGYDGTGNRNSVTASVPGATGLNGVTGYTYDSKDQVTQESSTRNGGFTDSFGYDSAGNPTSFKGITKTYNSNNQLTATGFSHDGNGNPTTYGGATLTFDPENRMTAYGSVMTAGYTGDGLRAWKQSASGRTYFLFDGTLPVAEIDSSGSVTATNSFGTAGLVSRREGSTSVFYSFDSEGNVSQRSDASGSILANHLFSAHGSILSGTLSEPFGYKAQVGYYTDNETSLQLLTHRYYDSSTGRFLTRDPIGFAGGINSYAYVGNSPVLHRDPSGLCPPEKKCKQDKTGGDMADIKDMLGRAGLLDQISIIGSAGQKNPEGIIFNIGNRQAFVDTLNADPRFRHGTPFGGEHASQVGASLTSVLDYRSFTTARDTLGIDSHGFRRSLQVDVGDPNPLGGAFGYADLDCDNPAQDVVGGVGHGGPIIGRRLRGWLDGLFKR